MIRLFKLFAGILILQFSMYSISFSQSKAEKINELIQRYNEYEQFNGSVLVAKDGKLVQKAGYGFANLEWDIDNAPNTKHRLGSITKQFTAMLILQQYEKGTLDLDAPITTYLPDYPKERGDKITIHHLLTHTSGIPNYTSFNGFFENLSRNTYTPEEFIHQFSDSTLNFDPGYKFSYSNSGYFLLGHILEKVTEKSYEHLLHEYIFSPLNMYATGYDHHSTILKNRATGYNQTGPHAYENTEYLDQSIPYAAGAMYSTVEDLFLWDEALRKDKLISAKTKALMFKQHIPTWGRYYGYGWGVDQVKIGNRTVDIHQHGGGINGFNTIIQRIPEDGTLIVLLNNTGGAPLQDISERIVAILYDQEYELPKPSVAMILLETINEKGLEAGLRWYSETKDNSAYELKEGEMNMVGYTLLREEKNKEAIAVFRLNMEQFPESSNTYDSLGEAYLTDGNKELALKNYRKSVELDPGNTNAVKIIEDLENK